MCDIGNKGLYRVKSEKGNLPMVGMVVTTTMKNNKNYNVGGVSKDLIFPIGIFLQAHQIWLLFLKTTVAVLTFTKLQFVKNGGFTGGIKSNHQDSHLLLAELHCKESTKDKDRIYT
jgi:hypothetical protein